MKRVLLTLAWACLLAGHAHADTFTIDRDTALTFRQIYNGGVWLQGVFDLTTTPPTPVYKHPTFGVEVYPDNPQGLVGFVGTITGDDNWMRIGVKNGDFGTYTGLRAFIANDNQSTWAVRLFANDCQTSWRYLKSPVSSDEGTSATLELSFEEMALTTFGFDVLLDVGNDPCVKWPSATDAFHVSVVPAPVPAAALLALLGLGAAGMKLRKFV